MPERRGLVDKRHHEPGMELLEDVALASAGEVTQEVGGGLGPVEFGDVVQEFAAVAEELAFVRETPRAFDHGGDVLVRLRFARQEDGALGCSHLGQGR